MSPTLSLTVLLLCVSSAVAARPANQTVALQDLLNAMGWPKVSAAVTACSYLNSSTAGQLDVRCNRQGEPVHIRISGAKMSSFPSSVGALSALLSLEVFGNRINGTIPKQLADIPQLGTLVLTNSTLSGVIPWELGRMGLLTRLDLSKNSLQGIVPSQLSQAVNITNINLGSNWLAGSIPGSLGTLPLLTYLDLQNNMITGSIPKELGNLKYISVLLLNNNNLFGNIPSELGIPGRLNTLSLALNKLTGSIPASLGNANLLSIIDLSWNSLTGTIPDTFNTLHLKFGQGFTLYLAHNYLTGPVPSSLFVYPAFVYAGLYNIDLTDNYLTGQLAADNCPANTAWVGYNCLLASPACKLTERSSQRDDAGCRAFCGTGVWQSSAPACAGLGTCEPVFTKPSFPDFVCTNCTRGSASILYPPTCALPKPPPRRTPPPGRSPPPRRTPPPGRSPSSGCTPPRPVPMRPIPPRPAAIHS